MDLLGLCARQLPQLPLRLVGSLGTSLDTLLAQELQKQMRSSCTAFLTPDLLRILMVGMRLEAGPRPVPLVGDAPGATLPSQSRRAPRAPLP